MKIDAYNLRARMIPVVLLVLPLIVAAATLGITKLTTQTVGVGGVGLLAVMLVAVVIVRRRGQALQDRMWIAAGGPPTTLLLRHSGPTPGHELERRHHLLAEATGRPAPTREEEDQDPARADSAYEEWTDWLIQQTRKDPVVLEEVTTYGFLRNSVGVRGWGIGLDIFVIAGGAAVLALDGSLTAIPPMLTAAAMIYAWVFVLTEAMVKQQAETYARSLYRALPALRTLSTIQ